jgi:hypothetical protein
MTKIPNAKKRISVNLAKVIEPIVKKYYKYIKIEDDENYKIFFTDNDENSNLFFGIIKESENNGGHIIDFACKPYSSTNCETGHSNLKIDRFGNVFTAWLENLKYYDADSILNDPILQGYQNEFYNDFKIVDSDADGSPFNYEQQLKLTEYIDNIIENIDSVKNAKNESIIKEIKNDFIDLQNSVTIESKNGFMKKLSKIFAKSRKGGIKISNFVVGEFIKGFINSGGNYAFNFFVNNVEKMPDYIEKIGQLITQLKS